MENTFEKAEEIYNRVCVDNDGLFDKMFIKTLIDSALLDAEVADEPKVYDAYITVISEYIHVSKISEFEQIMRDYWVTKTDERERSCTPH